MRYSVSKIATWAIMSLCVIHLTLAEAKEQSVEAQQDSQLMCLAQNIYYEAGTEQFRGKVAVAQVTVNRAESGNFPKTICGVVHQKTQIAGKTICQFSWACNPVGRIKYFSDAWEESLMVAKQVLESNLRMESMSGALYFHAAHINPHWGLERLARIGNHIFYSEDPAPRKKSLTTNQK
jgi:spore germination cell wall hydrolase CwlJ-like protein